MTQSQILQQMTLYNFLCQISSKNPLEVYTDIELMKLYRAAQEEQDGRKITAIKKEMSRRSKEQ